MLIMGYLTLSGWPRVSLVPLSLHDREFLVQTLDCEAGFVTRLLDNVLVVADRERQVPIFVGPRDCDGHAVPLVGRAML